MVSEYIFSGSLPESATTYVKREADEQLYEALKSGKFCYVLNSRQTGKSSLRVRTHRRLTDVGFACAAIDLSFDEVQEVTSEQWYVGLIDTLIDSFDLELDLEQWWYSRQLLSPLKRFRKFIEEVLLVEVTEQIIIFIDEIDSVLSLKFPTDDFFAFIRACYNQRADNPQYNRLTFCLLGVASPSNLIEDKRRTPFNIGQAITLAGFRLQEVEPLLKGLSGRFSNPQAVIEEILDWTGGQPFLTQKLCQLMVLESQREHRRSVEQVVREQIIESWEANDEPEHLRTIRDRIITRDEQKAGYLLELYQQLIQQGEIDFSNTSEQSELQLSGLVVRREGKLSIYNQIYQEVFNLYWIEQQLANLRPYSEAFRAWLASGCSDESRLLRGKTLLDAQGWAQGKNLSYQDKQFLAASDEKQRKKQIAQKEQEAQLERERKDREAAEKRNLVLTEANRQAKRQIRRGTMVLTFTTSVAVILSIFALWSVQKVAETQIYLNNAEKLAKLAGQLEDEGSHSEAKDLFSLAGQSVNVPHPKLKLAMLFAGISLGYQELIEPDLELARKYLQKSKKQLPSEAHSNSQEEKCDNAKVKCQLRILTLKTEGNLLKQEKKTDESIEYYRKAFLLLKGYSPFAQDIKGKILSAENVEAFHREFIELLSTGEDDKLLSSVKDSLKQHYLSELDNLLANQKWREADLKTVRVMLYIADREDRRYLDSESINNFSCKDLKTIDDLWIKYSDSRFGFSVQKGIWLKLGGKIDSSDNETYLKYVDYVGWRQVGKWLNYSQLFGDGAVEKTSEGYLPRKWYQLDSDLLVTDVDLGWVRSSNYEKVFFRAESCDL
ncbi:MAG: hypothetical protein F6K36_01105 [Symploca sp. SIO3C6]|nr:hypothetical protein [Symploca sp. SIO3C6]